MTMDPISRLRLASSDLRALSLEVQDFYNKRIPAPASISMAIIHLSEQIEKEIIRIERLKNE